MDDRELLELAATAVGYKIATAQQADRDAHGYGHVGLWIKHVDTCWNPLEIDSHALQLAVDLCMLIEPGSKTRGFAVARTGDANWKEFREPHEGDRAAATRRVIVRAAAANATTVRNESTSDHRERLLWLIADAMAKESGNG